MGRLIEHNAFPRRRFWKFLPRDFYIYSEKTHKSAIDSVYFLCYNFVVVGLTTYNKEGELL